MRGRKLTIVLAVLALATAVSCGRGEPAQEQGRELDVVRVGIGPFLSQAPPKIADEMGYFRDEGIEVKFVEIESSAQAIPTLAQGGLDAMSAASTSALFNAIARKSGIRVVSSLGQIAEDAPCNRHSIVASPRILATGELDGLADVKGKKVVVDDSNVDAYQFDKALSTVGLSIDDVERVEVEDAALPDALGKGDLDLAYAAEPELTRLVGLGVAEDWHQLNKYVPGMQFSMMIFGPRLLGEDRELGERFVRALLKGVVTFTEGKTPRNVEIVSEFTDLEPSFLEKTCWPSYAKDGAVNWESIDDIQHWFQSRDLLDETVSEEDFWTRDFIEAARS